MAKKKAYEKKVHATNLENRIPKVDLVEDAEMRNGKFTKGPWRVESFRDFASIMAGEDEICYIDDDLTCEEVSANARLIAAAPEMHALLGRVEDYFKNRHIYGYGVEESVSSDLLAKIQEAIKVVNGKKR